MKCFFVHIPKTAGNSVRNILRSGNLLTNPGWEKKERVHHFGVSKSKRVVGSHLSFTTDSFPCYLSLDAYKTASTSFTVIRNPFDTLVSYYSHYVDNSAKKNWIDRGWANVNGHHGFNSFEDFIQFYCSQSPEKWHVPELSKNLFGQIFDDKKNLRVDYAIYLENLEEGLKELIEVLTGRTVNLNIPKLNKSSHRKGSYQEYYNDDLIEMVTSKCEWELEKFDYGFNKETKQTMIKISDVI